jgi:two-component system KDP operon response regulator KdpE
VGTQVTKTAPTILVGDDEEAVRRVLSAQFTARGYLTCDAGKGREVLQVASASHPDLIVLDLGLPDMDGIEVIRRLRETIQTPIVVLSVRATESDKIAALEAGADDYLTKPFHPADLLERVRAALLRPKPVDTRTFVAGDLKVDLETQVVEVAGRTVQLTHNEFDLLRVLILNAGRLLTQRRLAREVWENQPEPGALQILRATINTLRSKLETDPARPRRITTEPGVGYRLRTET